MGYEELHRSFGPEEGASADEAKVRQMLGELKRVEAPKNFDFKLQARIANTRPEDLCAPGSRLVFLRYAMPLLLVLAVISGVVIVGLYRVDNSDVPEVAYSAPARQIDTERTQPAASPAPSVIAPAANTSPGERTVTPPTPIEGQTIASSSQPRREVPAGPRSVSTSTGGSSRDSALGNPAPIIDLNQSRPVSAAPPGSGPSMPAGQIPVQVVLDFSGIKTTYSNSGWRVTSVLPSSMADKAGIKTGDIVEGINGQPVTQGTKFSGELRVRSLKVARNGQTMDVQF